MAPFPCLPAHTLQNRQMTDTATMNPSDLPSDSLVHSPDSAATDLLAAPAKGADGEALAGDGNAETARPSRRNNPRGRGQQGAKPPQRSRDVHPVLQQLFALYPKMFGQQFLPLKLGVYQELLALHPEAFKREDLKVALGLHARSMRYLESVAAGHPRHDLQGVPVEPVAPEHVHHAILEVFWRHQARTKEDLRPHLRIRMMHAIEASGLSHDAYALLVRTQDERSNLLLDDALSTLKLEAAKREALARTFTASGQTVAQFADMYGMDPAEVARVVERVQHEQAPAPQASPL